MIRSIQQGENEMTSIDDNQIRPLTHDQLELVSGGGFLPIPTPPYQGGPVHTPILPPGVATPIAMPLFTTMRSGPLM
jgi:hypothetical protein